MCQDVAEELQYINHVLAAPCASPALIADIRHRNFYDVTKPKDEKQNNNKKKQLIFHSEEYFFAFIC